MAGHGALMDEKPMELPFTQPPRPVINGVEYPFPNPGCEHRSYLMLRQWMGVRLFYIIAFAAPGVENDDRPISLIREHAPNPVLGNCQIGVGVDWVRAVQLCR